MSKPMLKAACAPIYREGTFNAVKRFNWSPFTYLMRVRRRLERVDGCILARPLGLSRTRSRKSASPLVCSCDLHGTVEH